MTLAQTLLAPALVLLALTPSQERGQQIYLRGTSASQPPITAALGDGGVQFAAAILPCTNCHGDDGRGRVEANVRAADITPAALGRATTVNGRARAAYTPSRLKRAIAMGIDSGRNPLSSAMPRYTMTAADASDLLDYLAILGNQPQPGVTEDTIRIGVTADETLVAPPERIYGRRVVLVRDGSADVLLRIDMSTNVSTASNGVPTIRAQSLIASTEQQATALHDYARRIGAEPLLASNCQLPETTSLVLMTADVASACDIGAFPASLDRRIIVAAARPPAAAILARVVQILATLGREVTRASFEEALARQRQAVWLTTVDLKSRRLLAEPGW